MASYPFLVPLSVALTSNANGTMSYQLSTTEKLTVMKVYQKSTGAFDITNIRNSDGLSYTSGSASSPIDSDFISDVANENNSLNMLPEPIVLAEGKTIYIDVKDTSGSSNTIELLLSCIREIGN